MLAKWVAGGGHRGGSATKLPPPVVFGHFLLAAAGLVLWIIYLALDADSLRWVAFVLLVLVALGGFPLFARWLPSRRSAAAVPAGVGAGASRSGSVGPGTAGTEPAERHLPVPVVAAHGLVAVVTVVLVLLTALGVGS